MLLICIIQDVVKPVSTVVTVTFLALPTVKTIRVTYKVERVLCVDLGGLELNAIQVRW